MLLRIQTLWLNLSFFFLFFTVSALLIPILIVLGILLAPFGSWRRTMARIRFFIKVYGAAMMACGGWLLRVKGEQCGGKPPSPCIYVCNHRSAVDAFTMARLPNEIIQIVNIWPFKLPVLGFFAKVAGYLSIREMEPQAFTKRASGLLDQGVSIAAFPEGTRSEGREMGPFHGALFRLALDTGIPVVPVCLSGTETVMPKGARFLRPGLIRVRSLAPITKDAYQDLTPFKFKNMVRDILSRELDQMELAE
jgi:1-acyl-sn-glycerol-3-phosphate acyltransferase